MDACWCHRRCASFPPARVLHSASPLFWFGCSDFNLSLGVTCPLSDSPCSQSRLSTVRLSVSYCVCPKQRTANGCCSRPAASLPPPPPAFPAHRHSHAQVVFGTNMDEDTTIAITMPKSSWHGDSAGFCGWRSAAPTRRDGGRACNGGAQWLSLPLPSSPASLSCEAVATPLRLEPHHDVFPS